MELGAFKFMSLFLAFLLFMYSIVCFIDTNKLDPAKKNVRYNWGNAMIGLVYMMFSLLLTYMTLFSG